MKKILLLSLAVLALPICAMSTDDDLEEFTTTLDLKKEIALEISQALEKSIERLDHKLSVLHGLKAHITTLFAIGREEKRDFIENEVAWVLDGVERLPFPVSHDAQEDLIKGLNERLAARLAPRSLQSQISDWLAPYVSEPTPAALAELERKERGQCLFCPVCKQDFYEQFDFLRVHLEQRTF